MARRRKKYDIPKNKTLSWKEKGVIYTRVSSPQQVISWDWLGSQKKLCQERAKANNVEIVGSFEDSAKKWKYEEIENRDWLNSMIDFLRKQNKDYTKIHFVIVDDVDRIIRDVKGRREIKNQIEMLWWAKIYALKQKIEDTPEGKMIQSITMSVKQYQRESNARQVADKQKARMLNGYRPLYSPPWYTHVTEKWKWKVLVKTKDAIYIKDWIILFSEWILENQTALMEFLNSKWCKSKRWNAINLEFISRLLDRERLLKYAGYIHYEKRDVIMVKWKHEWLFWLDVVEKTLKRLKPKTYYSNTTAKEIWKQVPLRWFLYDTETLTKYTWWPSKWRRKTYIYYTCRIKQENWKVKTRNIMNIKLHDQFYEYLQKFTIDKSTLIIFENIMKEMYDKKMNLAEHLNKDIEKRIAEIDSEINSTLNRIWKTTNETLIEKYENHIITLEEEKQEIKIRIEVRNWNRVNVNIDELISNTKTILANPSFVRDLWDPQLQKMLIGVLFNGKILYNKKSGFQTPEIPLIYTLLSSFNSDDSRLVEMTGLEPVSESHNT